MINKSFLRLFCCVVFFAPLVTGCTYFPASDSISQVENQAVRTRFKEMIAKQKDCYYCLDGVVKTRFENFFYNGSIAGYLQAMSPASLKFMALSPLGQPLVVLTSDGETFQYVDVAKQTEYSGSVTGETFRKYAPVGFSPKFTYYWLTGKLRPGEVTIALTSRESKGSRYWIELHYADSRNGMVLFDPRDQHIYQHIVYNQAGDLLLELLYDDYGQEDCGIPRSITVTSLTLKGRLHIKLDDLAEKVSLTRGDFSYTVPTNFRKEVVE